MISAANFKKPRSTSRVRGKRGTETNPIPAYLLSFLAFLTGCLGESNIDPPTLPPGVTNISKSTTDSIAPSAASNGNSIYVVWAEGIGAVNDEIFLARSDNGGISFSTRVNVSNSTEFSRNPKVAISIVGTSKIVHIVWEEFISNPASGEQEFDIFYRRAVEDQAGSITFESPQNLSASIPICGPAAGGLTCPSQVPTIATFDNHVFVAWMESTFYIPPDFSTPGSTLLLLNSDILMISSTDHGVNFPGVPVILSLPNTGVTNQASPSQNPSLAATNGHLFIVWEDTPPPEITPKVLFRSFDIASAVFTPPIASSGISLSTPIENAGLPRIADEGNNVYLIWEGTDPGGTDSEIFLKQAGNVISGPPFSFSTARNLSNNTGRSHKGRIAVSGSNISISWEDDSTGPLVLFTNSTDGGGTFGNTQTLISSGNTIGNTAIAASGLNLFAFWEDALFGNFEILFSRR